MCSDANGQSAAVKRAEVGVVDLDLVVVLGEGELLKEGVALHQHLMPLYEYPRFAKPATALIISHAKETLSTLSGSARENLCPC